jgi:hypothetical protein
MNSQATIIAASVLALILIGAGVVYVFSDEEAGNGTPTPNVTTEELDYSSAAYGLAFSYPAKYFVTEYDSGTPQRSRHSIVLLEDTPFTRDLVAGKVPGTEAPPGITVDIFDNALDRTALRAWVEGNANSNFKLSIDGKLASTSIHGKEALSYTWDGLYRGDSVVVAHKSNIIMFSVTYHSPDDEVRDDFENVLSSVELLAE